MRLKLIQSVVKRALRILSLGVAVGSVAVWLAMGPHLGWTRTSVPVRTYDEITEIESIQYRKQFVPGLELLAAGLLAAGVLGGVSFFLRSPKTQTHPI